MRFISMLACSFALLGASHFLTAQAKPTVSAKSSAQPAAAIGLLPDEFAGWTAVEPPKPVTDAAQADPTHADVLKEFDFAKGTDAEYKRNGETLSLRAFQFRDVSGAYGAYSFYRQNGWPKEQIGSGATSDHNRVLFWLGDTLVDARFSQIGPMSGSELRELAASFPVPAGSKALLPPILSNLPKASLDGQTTHYALGPAGYAGAGGVLPAELVGFDRGAESVTANYSLRSGPATLTLIDYPTPQMAAAQEGKIRAYIKAGSAAQPAWPKPLQDSDPSSIEVRRSGPLVAVVSGDAIPDESHKLLGTVHYDADLIALPGNGGSGETEVAKTAKLLVGIAALVIIGCSAALLLGFFLGGGRALYRIARGKPISAVYEAEFIRIDLHEEWVEPTDPVDRPHLNG